MYWSNEDLLDELYMVMESGDLNMEERDVALYFETELLKGTISEEDKEKIIHHQFK